VSARRPANGRCSDSIGGQADRASRTHRNEFFYHSKTRGAIDKGRHKIIPRYDLKIQRGRLQCSLHEFWNCLSGDMVRVGINVTDAVIGFPRVLLEGPATTQPKDFKW
jgi:hypothetical protein